MRPTPVRPAPLLLVAACLLAGTWSRPVPAQDAGDVTIYRCTGPDGEVVIGNVPCGDAGRQQVRSMVRPVDGTPPARPSAPPAIPAAPVMAAPAAPAQSPQALYECVRADGSTYESDTGVGETRWIPVWDGWASGDRRHGGRPGPGTGARGATTPAGSGLSAPPVSRISLPSNPPRPDPVAGPRPRPPRGGTGVVGGYEVRDPCHVLPPAEACARLRDRRDDIRRRFFNAQQVERDTLRVEERGLNARIDRDCRI